MTQVECVVREDMFQGQSDDVGASPSANFAPLEISLHRIA
jgi:hypothetical protein